MQKHKKQLLDKEKNCRKLKEAGLKRMCQWKNFESFEAIPIGLIQEER